MWLDGVLLVGGVLLPGFRPTTRWRFGFGARSGVNEEDKPERHELRDVAVTLDDAVLRELENWLGGVTIDARAGKSRV